MKFLLLTFKNVRRNLLRSVLTALGTVVLVMVITPVWSALKYLDDIMAEKSKDFKLIVSEKWQFPSQIPYSRAAELGQGGPVRPGEDHVYPMDWMAWEFYGGTRDPQKMLPKDMLPIIALQPEKMLTMMDELDNLSTADAARFQQVVDKLIADRTGIILGRDRLKALNIRVGDAFTLTGMNLKGIDLKFRVVGEFPQGRYDNSAIMSHDYFSAALDQYKRDHNNKPHELADKTLFLVWLRVKDHAAYERVERQIAQAGYSEPAVKCETASSGIMTFMESYRAIIWGARWLLSPAIMITLSLVVANAVSISVRERRTELAVLKVLGFRPGQILTMVLGEALLIGVTAGTFSATLTYVLVNYGYGGIKFPVGFFPTIFISSHAMWWGLAFGAGAALAGSIIPAWHARNVKVSEVFAKVA